MARPVFPGLKDFSVRLAPLVRWAIPDRRGSLVRLALLVCPERWDLPEAQVHPGSSVLQALQVLPGSVVSKEPPGRRGFKGPLDLREQLVQSALQAHRAFRDQWGLRAREGQDLRGLRASRGSRVLLGSKVLPD